MKNLSKRIATIAASLALVVVLGVALAACGSKSYAELTLDEYKANLEKANYKAEEAPKEYFGMYAAMFGLSDFVEDIEWMLQGYSEEDGIYLVKFTSEDKAKDAKDAVEKAVEEAGEEDNGKIVRAGSVVIIATDAGLDAAYGD